MSDNIEKGTEAIKTILTSLESLGEDERKNVIAYVLRSIKFDLSSIASEQYINSRSNTDTNLLLTQNHDEKIIHIKELKESKSPKSAIEMAAIVAYHLANNCEKDNLKDNIDTADLKTWFQIAGYPLPKGDLKFLLVNTKNAGYFDSVGNGKYKLNAVGNNLVKYNLPKTVNQTTTKRPRKPLKKTQKKSIRK